MNDLSWYPRIICYATRYEDSMIYFGCHNQVKIQGHADVQQALLGLCTGYNIASEIVTTLSSEHDKVQLVQLLAVLNQQGILVDSGNCWKGYHPYSSNPMPFFSPPSTQKLEELYHSQPYKSSMECGNSPLLQLLCSRQSTRDFTNKPIPYNAILQIACAGYGITDKIEVMGMAIGRRTVPSAGALYPLSLHVVIRQQPDDHEQGIYTFDGVSLKMITKLFEDKAWQKCFLDDVYVQKHSACFIISGNIERQTIKYADRGYRYTILEAGHVAQNIILACTEMNNIGCVEIGGFIDDELANFLSLPACLIPITTVLVGALS
jgi:SagB-type dehydrogenase family enzyme